MTRRIGRVPAQLFQGLEVGELIDRRENRMCLAVALDLRYFVQRFPAGRCSRTPVVNGCSSRVVSANISPFDVFPLCGNGQDLTAGRLSYRARNRHRSSRVLAVVSAERNDRVGSCRDRP